MKNLKHKIQLFISRLNLVSFPKSSARGFSLVELIVYFGIFSILLLVLTNIFSTSISTQLESESLTSVEQDSRFLLLRLSNDIEKASSIVIPASAGNTSTTLQIVVNSQNYTYQVISGNLTLTTNSGTFNLNNYNTTISDFLVTRIGNINGKNDIKISFTITSKVRQNSGYESKTFNTTIGTR
jgi:type II secretory pathway pseudopilin PulG